MYDDLDDREQDDDDNIEDTFLTFAVGPEAYAISVSHVTEIVRVQQQVFAVPDVAAYVRGVINLRGRVIPLLDVRARFGLPAIADTDRTVIVVIDVDGAPTGLVVDGVYDITECPPQQREPAPGLMGQSKDGRESLVAGICKQAHRVSFLLDARRLVLSPHVVAVASDAAPRHA